MTRSLARLHRAAALLTLLVMASHLSAVLGAPYQVLTSADLPPANPAAASGNPLKGFLTNPDWHWQANYLDSVPSSLEFYYVGLNKVMDGPNSFTGLDTYLEPKIEASVARGKHVILRFYLDYPSEPTAVPQYLINAGLSFNYYTAYGGGQSPDYNNLDLLNALQSFIVELGRRYDGDPRIGFIQCGLIGFWGEWHTYTTRDEGWIPESTEKLVIDAFDAAFDTTQVQLRYPHRYAIGRDKFGLHDDSFAYSTLDGTANGGLKVSWFFWPIVLAENYQDFWLTGVMGGELRPEVQEDIFSVRYPAGTRYHQDFGRCVETTHATYMLNYYAFEPGYPAGHELDEANAASDRMGYAFRLSEVAVSSGSAENTVDIVAKVVQAGVAPFYYPLSLRLSCSDAKSTDLTVAGVETITQSGNEGSFVFTGIPSTSLCLQSLSFNLYTFYALPGKPVKWAQEGGATVTVSVAPPSPITDPPPNTDPPTYPFTDPPPTPEVTRKLCYRREQNAQQACPLVARDNCSADNDCNWRQKCWEVTCVARESCGARGTPCQMNSDCCVKCRTNGYCK